MNKDFLFILVVVFLLYIYFVERYKVVSFFLVIVVIFYSIFCRKNGEKMVREDFLEDSSYFDKIIIKDDFSKLHEQVHNYIDLNNKHRLKNRDK
jgi:hypothetical protein